MATLQDVMTTLKAKTDEGKVIWQTTAVNGTFVAGAGDFSFSVSKESNHLCSFTIYDRMGDKLRSVNSGDLPVGPQVSALYQKVVLSQQVLDNLWPKVLEVLKAL